MAMQTILPNLRTAESSVVEHRIKKILESGRQLWLVNCSDEVNEGGMKSLLNVNFTDNNGHVTPLVFPDTYLPINLTAHVRKEEILSSREFKTYINAGMLRPVPSKKAEAMLATEDAREEMERLNSRRRGSRKEAEKLRKELGKVPPSGKVKFDSVHPDDRGREKEEEPVTAVNNRVQTLCARVQSGGLTPRVAIAELRNIKLTQEDYGYIIGNSRAQNDDGSFDDALADWASERLVKEATRLAAARLEARKKAKEQEASKAPNRTPMKSKESTTPAAKRVAVPHPSAPRAVIPTVRRK